MLVSQVRPFLFHGADRFQYLARNNYIVGSCVLRPRTHPAKKQSSMLALQKFTFSSQEGGELALFSGPAQLLSLVVCVCVCVCGESLETRLVGN